MYGSWDMERDRENFLSFWIQKMQKILEKSSFYTSIPKIMIIYYTVLSYGT